MYSSSMRTARSLLYGGIPDRDPPGGFFIKIANSNNNNNNNNLFHGKQYISFRFDRENGK